MRYVDWIRRCSGFCLALLLAACGGGGSGSSSSGDIVPGVEGPVLALSGPDSYLLFPNPQRQPDGVLQTDSLEYAQAYYAAIDPQNLRDTLDKFRQTNGFGVDGAGTEEVTVVVGDKRDLGYGRRITARRNADGTMAFLAENYLVEAGSGYSYSMLHLDAAVANARRWHIGTNGIEFSPGPAGGVPFVKFYTFDPLTGARALEGELDGRGHKAMPGICTTCHGGRGDPLTPPDAQGKRLFPLVPFAVSGQRGDVQGRLHALEPDALDFSTVPGFTRAAFESKIKTINQMVLCSYPLATPSDLPEDRCRRAASVNEYQGVAANHVKAAYGGPGMPSPTYQDSYVDASWTDAGQGALYRNVLTPACRVCHLVRGTGSQSDIDFATFDKFDGYSDRTKAHMVDRGNMPLAKLVSDAFYASAAGVASITGFLSDKGYADAAMRPGRPVADPGPGRVVRRGATTLSAAGSLFASSYQWSIISGPNGAVPPIQASLSLPNTAQPVFNASADGSYVLQLIASSASSSSVPATLTLVVRDDLRSNGVAYAPAALRFADVKAVLQSANAGCTGCHNSAGEVLPPIHFIGPDQSTDIDRNGDGRVDATDNLWFYAELRGRINFTDIVASPLLRKPSGNHHAGGQLSGFDTSFAPGHAARSDYDLVLSWILNGAPYD